MNNIRIIYPQRCKPIRDRIAETCSKYFLAFIFGVMAGYAWGALAYGKF